MKKKVKTLAIISIAIAIVLIGIWWIWNNQTPEKTLPLITSANGIEEYVGQKVRVIGTLECNPDPPNRFGKFVPGLIFSDGTEIGFTGEVSYCEEYQNKEIELICEIYQCGLEDSCEGILLREIDLIE